MRPCRAEPNAYGRKTQNETRRDPHSRLPTRPQPSHHSNPTLPALSPLLQPLLTVIRVTLPSKRQSWHHRRYPRLPSAPSLHHRQAFGPLSASLSTWEPLNHRPPCRMRGLGDPGAGAVVPSGCAYSSVMCSVRPLNAAIRIARRSSGGKVAKKGLLAAALAEWGREACEEAGVRARGREAGRKGRLGGRSSGGEGGWRETFLWSQVRMFLGIVEIGTTVGRCRNERCAVRGGKIEDSMLRAAISVLWERKTYVGPISYMST